MDLTIIREFAVLADTCNFQIAAESLSMSQSALSKHIQKLEDELNLSLFDRTKRSVTLNDNGKTFLIYARQICQICDECEYALRNQNKARENSLNIGFMKIHDQYPIIEQLTDFAAAHPEIRMSYKEPNGDQIKSQLTTGECDFIFAADVNYFPEEEFIKNIYRTDRLVVFVPEEHRLALKDHVTLDDLSGERLIEHSMPLERQLFTEFCAGSGFVPDITASISSASTILRMIKQGLGISVISEGCAEQCNTFNLVMVPLIPEITFNIYLVYKRRRLSAASKEFINYFSNLETR